MFTPSPKKLTFFQHDIAEIYADAKAHLCGLGEISIERRYLILYFHRGSESLDGAVILGNNTVARGAVPHISR